MRSKFNPLEASEIFHVHCNLNISKAIYGNVLYYLVGDVVIRTRYYTVGSLRSFLYHCVPNTQLHQCRLSPESTQYYQSSHFYSEL